MKRILVSVLISAVAARSGRRRGFAATRATAAAGGQHPAGPNLWLERHLFWRQGRLGQN